MSVSPQLKPTSRLFRAEASAIEAVKQGEPFRSTVSLDPSIALAAIRAADLDGRDFSNFCARALTEYCEEHGLIADQRLTELIAKLSHSIKVTPMLIEEVEALLSRYARIEKQAELNETTP